MTCFISCCYEGVVAPSVSLNRDITNLFELKYWIILLLTFSFQWQRSVSVGEVVIGRQPDLVASFLSERLIILFLRRKNFFSPCRVCFSEVRSLLSLMCCSCFCVSCVQLQQAWQDS